MASTQSHGRHCTHPHSNWVQQHTNSGLVITLIGNKSPNSSASIEGSSITHPGRGSISIGNIPHSRRNESHGRCCITINTHIPRQSNISNTLQFNVSITAGCILDNVQPTQFNLWKNLLNTANHHNSNGVVAAHNKKFNNYWQHWTNFLWPNFDQYLQDLNQEE